MRGRQIETDLSVLMQCTTQSDQAVRNVRGILDGGKADLERLGESEEVSVFAVSMEASSDVVSVSRSEPIIRVYSRSRRHMRRRSICETETFL